MSNRENPSTMVDVDLSRLNIMGAYPYVEQTSVTIYNGEDDELDNMLHQGWTVQGIVTVL